MKGRGFVREGEEEGKDEGRWCAFVGRELDIVMRAGERHPGNYHAWNYAREVVRLFVILSTRNGCKEREDDAIEAAWRQWIELVHRWCFGHPRDMSGWAFLSFLLDQHVRFTEHGGKGMNGDVFRRTQEFKGKLKWEGECVEWFLRSASRFQIGINNE